MLSIGEFSRVTQLSIKTIRLYHEKGLLLPADVDDGSGYRYYDGSSVEKARIIQELRALDFPLADIAQILESGEDEGDIVSFLEKQKDEIARKLNRFQEIHRALDTIVNKEREATMMIQTQNMQVVEKSVGDLLIAGIRGKGVYSESKERFSKLGRAVGRHIAGKPLGLYFDTEYKEGDADFESCFPIHKTVEKEGISVRRLEGGRCVSLIYVGPYSSITRAYQQVFEYIHAKGLKPKVPSREVYIKGPGMIFKGNPKKYVTEIQVFVEE